MPQKRNPIGCAYICSMSSTVRGMVGSMVGSMVEAVVPDLERSADPWEFEWIVLPQIVGLCHKFVQVIC